MPYSERVAEAYIEAKDRPRQQDMLARQGQFDKDPVTGESYMNPKYRLPTPDEAKQTVQDIKAGTIVGAGTIGMGLGPIAGPAFGTVAAAGMEKMSPSLENWVNTHATIPVYENWNEGDFMSAYGGS